MAKVFRLHKGNDTIVDWQESSKYGIDVINQIKDPDGDTAKKEITSIPSPFARIDLVKTAFKVITESKHLEGDTVHHKMISDSFDVGEIFFNAEKLTGKVKILVWDRDIDLKVLIDSTNPAHRALGETLNMYLVQDADAYNFHRTKRIYLLNYTGKDRPAPLSIIGATSPSTLFFSSANKLDYISKHIQFGQDKVFDNSFQPLYKRDFEFQKYLYTFKLSYNRFNSDFPEISEYLNLNYKYLSDQQKKQIDELTENSINNYEKLHISGGANIVEILGHPLHKKKIVSDIESDFEVDSAIYKGKKPLVLPIEAGNTYTGLKYTQSNWHKSDQAPVFDNTPWQERTLPIVGDKYPYLTISDFLGDTIIRMPFELNKDAFFDGNTKTITDNSFLLPLTELFFEFFSVDELLNKKVNGKKMLEMSENSGGISLVLRIPLKNNNHIEYRRLYFDNNQPNLTKNEGAVILKEFGLGILPNIEFSDNKPNYRIALFDEGDLDIRLEAYKNTLKTTIKERIVRRDKGELCSIESYILEDDFDRIILRIGSNPAILIPKFTLKNKKEGTSQFTFAVDFGTTNTHIEYSVDGKVSRPFDVLSADKQIQRLHLDYKESIAIKYAFEDNFIPDTIGDNDFYRFPMRTVFAEYERVNYNQATYTLASGNIPFRYEKIRTPLYNKTITDLKWSFKDKQRVKLFLENIFLLMRNKVLLNGGDLEKTKIVWFYPASMTEAHCSRFNDIWQEFYKKYFGDNKENILAMSESIAPYVFYTKKRGAKSNVVTIDIGGGTTDVYVVENDTPKTLSSFRYASNAVFGDGYNWDSDNNGFVKIYGDKFLNILNENDLSQLKDAYHSIESNKTSTDIITFFFGLSSNRQIAEKQVPSLDFLQKLSENDKLVYSFIIFYGSIIYYIANLLKANGFEMPLTIAFSGNGSKSLNVLSTDKTILQKFFKLIVEKVFDKKYSSKNDLDLIIEENPKEATCKGGILNPKKQEYDSLNSIKSALLGSDMKTPVNGETFSAIDKNLYGKVVLEAEKFIDFIFDINKENDNFFTNKLGADATIIDFVKDTCKVNLEEYLKLGIQKRQEELNVLGMDDSIKETLFFFPFVGMLNNLARETSRL